MTYEQCKCGSLRVWGSGYPVARCSPCAKCGSVPAIGPNSHPDPIDHDFSLVSEVNTDAGPATLTRCRYCLKTQREVAA